MAIILKGSPSASINTSHKLQPKQPGVESINTSHKLQPKQPGVELLDNGYSRLKIGSTTNLSNLDDSSGWIEWSNLPYATPNPQIYTDTKINFAAAGVSGTIPEEQLIACGAGYHEMYGYSVGLHGGTGIVRAGYNGNNQVELSGDGTNWVVIGPSTLYPTSSTMTLGSSSSAWSTVYTNRVQSKPDSGPILYMKPGQTGSAEYGWSFGQVVDGSDTTGVTISRVGDNQFKIGTYSTSIYLDSSSGWNTSISFAGMNYMTFTYSGTVTGGQSTVSFYPTNTNGTVGTLGTSENSWDSVFLGEMQLQYNTTEECIEFLVA